MITMTTWENHSEPCNHVGESSVIMSSPDQTGAIHPAHAKAIYPSEHWRHRRHSTKLEETGVTEKNCDGLESDRDSNQTYREHKSGASSVRSSSSSLCNLLQFLFSLVSLLGSNIIFNKKLNLLSRLTMVFAGVHNPWPENFMPLRNVDNNLQDYTMSQPRRP
jgi:hypothetical protein